MINTHSLLVSAAAILLVVPALADDGVASLDAAAKAFEEGRLEDCVSVCDKVPDSSKDHRKAVFLRAESLLRLGKPKEAQAGFEVVLAENAKSVPAMIGFGRSLDAQGAYEKAEDALRAAVKRDKKSAYAHRVLGEFFIARRKFSDARTTLSKSWKLDSKDPLTAIALVDVHLGYEDAKSSIKVAKQLIKARPTHPVGHFLHGRALEYDGDWKDAIEAYEKAVECDTEYLDAHKNLAIVCHTQNAMYRDKELLEKSMAHYERYFELGGKEPELRNIYDQMVGFLKWEKENQ
jgi:tetratricopeptide (TPR) repeat protein